MSRIRTHRNAEFSIFVSLVEHAVHRIEARQGRRLGAPAADEATARAPRRSLGHVAHDLAVRIVSHRKKGEEPPAQPPTDLQEQHGSDLEMLWTCAKLSAEIVADKIRCRHEAAQAKHDELKFSGCDPEWAEALLEYFEYFGLRGGRREIPYIRHQSMDDFVLDSLPENAVVAVVGDWGTGTDEAIAVLDALARHQPDVVIHLGDIYYAGTERETQAFFLDLLNKALARDTRPVPVYTLTGNHDMYSGGVGYYTLLPQLNPEPLYTAAQAQPASYFALRNEAWQLLCMDTGLHDHDPLTVSTQVTWLEPSEEAWHVDKVGRFAATGGRTILFSHHQLFSAFERIGRLDDKPAGEEAANPKLLASLRKMQQAALASGTDPASREIAAWFWGHEHKLAVYEPYLGLARGRCLGHGAIPDFLETKSYLVDSELPDPPKLVADPADPSQSLMLASVDQVYAHGFLIVSLDDAQRRGTVRYYQETDWDRPMFEEEL
ncbi:MAG: metallophosphoesterase [Acidobacteriota bacterium]